MRWHSLMRRALPAVALTALPAALTAVVVRVGLTEGYLGIDFLPLRRAALDLAAGRAPWPAPAELPAQLATGTAYVYPPLAALAAAPLAVLPETAATLVWTALLVGATLLALRLLGVRDARCHGAAFLWGCVVSALQSGNVTLLLVLGLAALWRARNHGAAAVVAGLLIALKPFLWPLLAWLVAYRRPRAALAAAGVAASATVVTWALVGFEGLLAYPDLLRALHRVEESQGYTVLALALDAGAPRAAALAVHLLVGGVLVAACLRFARRGDGAHAFALAVGAAIALSTVVWLHYFALLLIPLAILRPRLGLAWFLPLAFWLGTGTGNGAPWQTATVVGAAALTLAVALRGRAQPAPEASPARCRAERLPAPLRITDAGDPRAAVPSR